MSGHLTLEPAADPVGYRKALARVAAHGATRIWDVEGTGSYGAGPTEFLQATGERSEAALRSMSLLQSLERPYPVAGSSRQSESAVRLG